MSRKTSDHKLAIILETAVQDDKVTQDFELELLLMGGDHSQKVKEPPIRSDYGSKDSVNLSSSTAVSRIIDKTPEKPWYNEGLRFKCTECGQCCTGAPGYVWVSEKEIAAMAEHLQITPDAFSRQYLRYVDGRYSLLENRHSYDCIFLKGKRCQIYSARPKQCRTYPWWPDQLESEKSWAEEAKWCEGINQDAPIVPLAVIQEQLEIQMNPDKIK
jgi:uncharacterized protein